MGCGATKVYNIDDSVRQVSDNPAKGLPSLLATIKQPGQQADGAKNVQSILKVMPHALESLKMADSKAIVTACNVIVQCVQIHNNGGAIIDDDTLSQCQKRLFQLMNKVEDKARHAQIESFCNCDRSTKEARAIAEATLSLFKLEGHATKCKEEFSGGGMRSTVELLRNNSGIDMVAKQALASMLCEGVQDCAALVDAFVTHGGVPMLRSIALEESKQSGIPNSMQIECCKILEACVKTASALDGKDELQAAIDKCFSSCKGSK